MVPMRFPPFLFFVLVALILFGGFELLFKFALIAALFIFFGKFFGFGRWGWDYPEYPEGRPGRYYGRGWGHRGHRGRHAHGPYGRRGRGHGPWGWDWDEADSDETEHPKKKNAPHDDDTVDAEAWV